MTTLGLDTSSQTASCAVCRDGKVVGECYFSVGLTHSQTSMAMAAYVLKQSGIRASELDVISVCVGPGSFTGLRIGVSQAKGLAQPGNTVCAGVSTLEALAWNLPMTEGVLAPCLDARRQQVYGGLYRWQGGRLIQLMTDACLQMEDFCRRAVSYGLSVTFLGDGGAKAYDFTQRLMENEAASTDMCYRIKETKPKTNLAPEPMRYVRGSSVALCGERAVLEGRGLCAEQLEPMYLRLPEVYQGREPCYDSWSR